MAENVNHMLREEEVLFKLKCRGLESLRQTSDVDAGSDDWETECIDKLLRSQEWNQLVKQSTTTALPKTVDRTVANKR